MNVKCHNSEKGQAIVYLVVGIVVFFGFVAMAVDGGMALADRRHSQNSADAASLAGGAEAAHVLEQAAPVCYANWTCSDGGDAMAHADIAGRARAQANGFNIDNNVTDHNAIITDCSIASDKYIDVTVLISGTTQSNFLQLVFPQALHNEVDATTRVHPAQPIGIDAAVIGLNPGNCDAGGNNGVTINGSGNTTVIGGAVFSNGCIRGNGNAGSATVNGGNGDVEGHYISPGNLTWNPPPATTSDLIQPTDFTIQGPALDASGNCIGGNNVNNLPNTLTPGLWCVRGNLNINQDITGVNVTIYMLDGHIYYNGNAKVELSAPTTNEFSPAINGILLYVPNGGTITLNGTSDDVFAGMIYAPKSTIILSGNANNIFNGQVLGWDVKLGGTNDMTVNFDSCRAYHRPPFIELYK